MDSAIFRHPTGVKAITSSNELADVEPDTEDISQILEEASKDSDFVLVDFPPGLDSTVSSIMEGCDELIIVTMPTQTAGINAAQITEKAKLDRHAMLGSIINKVEERPDRELINREVETMTETHILSEIPYDPEMKEALFHHKPLVEYKPLSKASIEIKSLAADITGEKYSKPKFAKFKRKVNELKEKIS
jgi:MinD-like ATPase involved in chromosome partitioning or flagellar assembly